MEIVSAGGKIRAGKSFIGKTCAVRASANRRNNRLHSFFLKGCLCNLDNIHMVFQLFFHIEVAVLDYRLKRCALSPVFLIQLFSGIGKDLLFFLKLRLIVVTDNIIHLRMAFLAGHIAKMEKTFIALCICRNARWKQAVKFHSKKQGIEHLVLSGTGMHIHTVDLQLSGSGIEVFILHFTKYPSVHSIGNLCSEARNIKDIRTASNFLIRRKTDTNIAVRHFLMT